MDDIKHTNSKHNGYVIKTLGGFQVSKHGTLLTMSASSSKKIWELFKFLLTYRERAFTPEALMDQLWVMEVYNDPRGTLRRQMHRLRQILSESGVPDSEQTILFNNGYYQWNPEVQVELDVVSFIALIEEGDQLMDRDPKSAVEAYMRAFKLYDGDYLPDCFDQHWVFPARNQYRRLLTAAMAKVIHWFKSEGCFEDIILLCEKVIQIDFYEESFHTHLLEAYLETGKKKKAFDHYSHVTEFYEREMGIKPSMAMRNLYKRMLKNQDSIENSGRLDSVLDSDQPIENAFFCESDVFKSIYELEQRRFKRSGGQFGIGLLTVDKQKGYSYGQMEIRMEQVKQHLMTHLRKGDSFTRWNDSQFIVLLYNVDGDLTKHALKRVLMQDQPLTDVRIDQIKGLKVEPEVYLRN